MPSPYKIMELLVFCTNSRILTLETGGHWTKPTGRVQREPRGSRRQSGPKLVFVEVDKQKG